MLAILLNPYTWVAIAGVVGGGAVVWVVRGWLSKARILAVQSQLAKAQAELSTARANVVQADLRARGAEERVKMSDNLRDAALHISEASHEEIDKEFDSLFSGSMSAGTV